MKWFRHETTAHTNLKLQNVIEVFGMEGYGYYWACLEIIGLQGENFRLKSEKNWKIYLKKQTNIPIEKQETILSFFSDNGLVDSRSLKNGSLSIPKMDEYSDEYTKKRRRMSVHDTDNVVLQDNTIHNNTLQDSKAPQPKLSFGEFSKVRLTEEEHLKLIEKIGEKMTQTLIVELDSYVASKGKKYSSHYATILNWSRRRESFSGNSPPSSKGVSKVSYKDTSE